MNAPLLEHSQAMPKTLTEWLVWLERPRTNQIKLGLDRMLAAANRLGCRLFSCPIILVAGTNGKGTTVSALNTVYREAGYRIGSYFSPHLECFNERIQINLQPISDDALSACFAKIYQQCDGFELSYFEYTTLAAMLYFKSEPLDVLIFEVGLGGRLDATNILEPTLSIITTVDFDHQAILGNSLEAIGFEKAGILRHKTACVLSTDMPKTVYQQAKRLEVKLLQLGKDYRIQYNPRCQPIYEDAWGSVSLHPEYHPEMQAGAIAATRLLHDKLPIHKGVLESGLKAIRLPGRQMFLELENAWQICLDVAHNAQSVRYLAQKMMDLDWRPHIVFSCLADKDYSTMIAALVPFAQSWQLFPITSPRALKPAMIAEEILRQDSTADLRIHSNATNALKALFFKESRSTVLICGSFHTVGEGMAALRPYYRI